MKKEELRIGNWINYNGCEQKIISLFFDQYEESEIEFIPLTENLLLRFGFVSLNFSTYEKGFIIEQKEASKSIYIRTYCEPNLSGFFNLFNRCNCNKSEIQFIASIFYVHQLQNLYFCLTGKELILKNN